MTELLIDLYKNEFEKNDWSKLLKIPLNLRITFIALLCNVIILFISATLFADEVIFNSIMLILLFLLMIVLHFMIRSYDKKHVEDYIQKHKTKIKKFKSVLDEQFDISSMQQFEKLSSKLSNDLPNYLYITNFMKPFVKFFSVIVIPLCVFAYPLIIEEQFAGQGVQVILAIILIIIYFYAIIVIMKPIATSIIESKHRVLIRVIDLLNDIIILDSEGS